MTVDATLLSTAAADGHTLVEIASSDWSRPIPHCPGWDAADLTAHVGGIFSWMAQIVTTGQQVDRKDRETPPDDLDQRADWCLGHLDRTIEILDGTPPDTPAWTFSSRGVENVGWWRRRIAVETAIHRWDVEHAATADTGSVPFPLDSEVSEAGIGEFLAEFLPGMLALQAISRLSGGMHLQATDRAVEWSIDLGARGDAVAFVGPTTADLQLRGTSSDLLLYLTNREPSVDVVVSGNGAVTTAWHDLKR